MSNTEVAKSFKRPIFGPYGYGNVKPMMGGVVYGEYMMSHNIEPEVKGENKMRIEEEEEEEAREALLMQPS